MCFGSGVECNEEKISMSSNFRSVEVWLELPKSAFVQLKNGLKILLFSVGVSISTPSYAYSDIEPTTQIIENNYQTEQDLFSSLSMHRADQMNSNDMDGFWTVAKEITFLDFKDSMVCYEPEDRQITYDILDKSGLVLHITQYLDHPKDQVVYSIEKDAKFLIAGHTPINNMGPHLDRVVKDLLKEIG